MPETYLVTVSNPDGTSIYVQVDGVETTSSYDGVLYLKGVDGKMLFFAPIGKILFVKARPDLEPEDLPVAVAAPPEPITTAAAKENS